MRFALRQISKAFSAPVLQAIDLQLLPGEVHALIGENGAGKSTLCRIIGGLLAADGGTMTLDGAPYAPASRREAAARGVRLCLQELPLVDTLTVAENIFLEALPARWGLLDRRRLRDDARVAMDRVGLTDVDPEAAVGSLGVGRRQLVEIAAALAYPARLVILDEPTAALGPVETRHLLELLGRLKGEGRTFLFISHRLEEIAAVADRVSVLRDGILVATRDVAGTLPAEMIREMIRLMVGRQLDEQHGESVRPAPGGVMLQVAGLCAGTAVRDVSFEVRAGEILGLAGLMGAGRTETLRAIFGAGPKEGGAIKVHGQLVAVRSPSEAVARGLALITEDRRAEGLLLPMGIAENVSLAHLSAFTGRWGLWRSGAERAAAEEWRRKLAIRSRDIHQPIGELSGGSQQKAIVARWLLRDPDILLLDEPTRGIDVGARGEIHQLAREFAARGKAVVVASSDMRELMQLCDRITVLSLGRTAATFDRPDFSEAALLTAALIHHRQAAA